MVCSAQSLYPRYHGLIEQYTFEDTSFIKDTEKRMLSELNSVHGKDSILHLLALAQIETSRKKNEKAAYYYLSALSAARKFDMAEALFWSYYKTGCFYYFTNASYSKTIKYFYLARQYYIDSLHNSVYQKLLRRIAYIELMTDNFPIAEKTYFEVLALNGFGRKQADILAIYNNLSTLYIDIRKFDLAKNYLDTTLQMALKGNDSLSIARCYVNYGNLYREQRKNLEAVTAYQKSYAIQSRNNYYSAAMESEANLGKVYLSMGQFEVARKKLEKVQSFSDTAANGTEHKLYILSDLATCYYKLGQSKLAYEYLKQLDEIKQNTQLENEQEKIRQLYSEFNFEKKLIEDSLKYSKQALEAKYEARQALALKDQQHKQNTILLILFLITILIIGFVLFVNQKQKNILKLKISETKALQAQMNPHFIFNSLNSVLEFVSKARTEDAINYLTRFSRLIRMVLEHSGRKTVLLSEELEMLKHYIALENVRSEHPFEFVLDISPSLDTSIIEIPTMLLQPFIENSIIHGIMNKIKLSEETGREYKGKLSLQLREEDGFLICEVEDNGVGIEHARAIKEGKIIKHQSMGLQITKHRLNLIDEKDSRITYFDLKDENGASKGTRVEIVIPLKEAY